MTLQKQGIAMTSASLLKPFFVRTPSKMLTSTPTNFVAVLGQYQVNIVVDSGVDV
jgi:hypothetical protein